MKSRKRGIFCTSVVLPKPLEKPAAERIKRIVGFENTKQELKQWNAVIMQNRAADSLEFPLNNSSLKLEPSNEFVENFSIRSNLEKKLAALEPQKENNEQQDDKVSLTLRDIIANRKKAARLRAQQSYKEAKAYRQNKIKSKKFHRIQRKEKIKHQLKEFETLQKIDPKAAFEKFEQLDKTRAQERMSLRHKNTGKWAKSKQIRAKYDKEMQQELAQQLSISRDLTQKLKKPDDSEEEDNESYTSVQPIEVTSGENLWAGNIKTEEEMNVFINNYRKYWDNKNKKVNITGTTNTLENKEANILSKDTDSPKALNDKNIDVNIEIVKIGDNKKTLGTTNCDRQVISSDSKSDTVLKDDVKTQVQPSEIKSKRKNLKTTKLNIKHTKNNSSNEMTQKTLNKKSNENVKSVENSSLSNLKRVINTLSSDTSNTEKINKIFDFMEKNIQDQTKSKPEPKPGIIQKLDKVKKKRKTKNVRFEEDIFDGLEMQTQKQKPIIDSSLDESTGENRMEFNAELERVKRMKYNNEDASLTNKSDTESKMGIDPNECKSSEPRDLNTDIPLDVTGGDDVLDDSEAEEEILQGYSEAFADDDVVHEFRKEKEKEVKKSQPKDIDLTLPGWGSWGGRSIKVSKRKRNRFILKMPKDLPRKDENKGNVVILEEANPAIRKHQVNRLPYPFTSVKDFEASIRMPIGRNFVPENSHRKLIEPAITTRMGAIIEPMDEDILVKKEKNYTIRKGSNRTIQKRKKINKIHNKTTNKK